MNPNFRTCCVLHFILLASHLSTKQYLIRLAIYWLIQFSGCEGDSAKEVHDELKHKYLINRFPKKNWKKLRKKCNEVSQICENEVYK